MTQDFEFKIFVPTIFFGIGYAKSTFVRIKNKELKITYMLFFTKKINTDEITNIDVKDNILLGKEKDLVVQYNNKTMTFQFFNTNNLKKLKEAIITSKNLK